MIKYTSRYLDERDVLRRWMDPRLSAVHVGQIQSYLRSKGWKEVPSDRPHVLVFQEPEEGADGPLYQFVPSSDQRRDYTARIYELLAALGEIENRYAGDILTDILQQSAGNSSSTNGPTITMPAEPARK